MSSTDTSPEQPKKRVGRKPIQPDQKKRIYWIKCPCCNECFEWYHGRPEMKPQPVTSKDMSVREKNKIYQQRYRNKKKEQNEDLVVE